MNKERENSKGLGMLFVKTNAKTGANFLSGFVEIDGKQTRIIGNKAKSLSKNGEVFYVLFENDYVPADEGKSAAPAKAAIVKGKAKADEEIPF